jgi:glycosyltransferase involved in cell wall biosynthesis
MKVVDVNPFFYPFFGGIEHRMHMIAKEMVKRGHEVTIVTGRLPNTEERETTDDGYEIIRLPSKTINLYNPPYISSKGVLETLDGLGADVVNYNYRWAGSYNRDLAKYSGKKVFTYHNMWGEGIGLQQKLSEINDNRFRKVLDTFDHIIGVSDYVCNDLIRRGIPASCVTTVNPCLERYPELSDSEGDFILSLGRLVRTKGLDYLVEAMKDIDCKLIICGKGPDSKRISKLIEREGLENKIEMKGWVAESEKEHLMSTCKFFVMPSIFESYGLAALEIMSYGRPVIATDVDGLPDTVGGGGMIIEPKNPKAISDAANLLLKDSDKRRELGVNARSIAEGRSVSQIVNKLEDIYSKVLSGELSNNRH